MKSKKVLFFAKAFVALCVVVMSFPSIAFGFAPSDLANLSLWLKADSLGLTDGTPVSSWTDSSGNNNNATQDTSDAQPIFKTNILQGKPVLRFDGVNDKLSETLSGVSNTNYTVFLVAKSVLATGSFRVALGYGSGTGGILWMGQFDSTNEITISGSQNGNDLKSGADTLTNHVYSAVLNSGTLYGYIDGVSAGSGIISDRPSDYLTIGSYSSNSLFWQGDIAEVIVYNSSLNDTDRQQVENYLNTKYINTPPVVSITNPVGGDNVRGAVLLTATASDDVSVSGVQFKLDTNTLIGDEITTGPYTLMWNNSNVSNGSHTISAVARDGSGNYATSTVSIVIRKNHSQYNTSRVISHFTNSSSPSISNILTPVSNMVSTTTSTSQIPVQDLSVTVLFPEPKASTTSITSFKKDLWFGMIDPDVMLLQKYLNTHGYTVALSGPGSLNNETSRFGSATKKALIKFQQANNITPTFGFFGPITRLKINSGL